MVVVLFAPCYGCSGFVLGLFWVWTGLYGFFSGRFFCLSNFVGLGDMRFDWYYIGMYKGCGSCYSILIVDKKKLNIFNTDKIYMKNNKFYDIFYLTTLSLIL